MLDTWYGPELQVKLAGVERCHGDRWMCTARPLGGGAEQSSSPERNTHTHTHILRYRHHWWHKDACVLTRVSNAVWFTASHVLWFQCWYTMICISSELQFWRTLQLDDSHMIVKAFQGFFTCLCFEKVCIEALTCYIWIFILYAGNDVEDCFNWFCLYN